MKVSKIALPVVATLLLAACSGGNDPAPTSGSEARTTQSTTPAPPSVSAVEPEPNPYTGLSAEARNRQLVRAAHSGNAPKIALLLATGVDLETRDADDRTPLLIAATYDRVGAARALIEAGADPDALDNRHDTPWLVTGVTGSVAMAEVILAASPDLTIRNRFGGLSHIPASERGHADYVDVVLDRTDIAVDHVNDLGWTALLEAVILGRGSEQWQRIVQSLVDHGADPTIADRDGVTPIQHARASGFTEIVRILERAES